MIFKTGRLNGQLLEEKRAIDGSRGRGGGLKDEVV